MIRPALDDLIALALEAGAEIMAVRDAGFDAQTKRDGSPVTIADRRAEAIIEAGLARLAPDIPMIGEEAAADGRIPEIGPRFFCVDPLDGTKGFVAGGDEFTVNIALIEHGAPILGVVFAPATGEIYAGEPGLALRGRTPIKSARSTPPEAWRVIVSRHSGRDRRTKAFATALGAHTLAHASSSIKFCRLAEGAADLYPRFGDVSEWDAAAGHAILAAAGGGAMGLDGAPLAYGARPGHKNSGDFLVHGFIAFASAPAAAAALEALRKS